MAEPLVEFGAEGINYFVHRYWDRGYDSFKRNLSLHSSPRPRDRLNTAPLSTAGGKRRRQENKNSLRHRPGCADSPHRQPYKNTPSVLRGGSQPVASDKQDRDTRLDRHTSPSHRSAPISRPCQRGHSPNPTFTPEPHLSHTDPSNSSQPNSTMSYANGGLSAGGYQQQQRANSAQPPRTRYYDDDEEEGSDYDDRTGRRYNDTGRGYDNQYYDDRGYGREVIETERYKGPARDFENRRQSFRSNDPNAGAMTQYNRQNDDYYQSRRSRSRGSRASRGRRDRSGSRSRSRSRSYSRSRSGSRGGGERGLQHKIGEHFDTSLQGIGVGLAGAVVGGMAGRHFGERNPRHKNRDILIGALVGGFGANAAENKWRGWMDEKKERVREDEERWDQKFDGRDYGRSRSAMR